MKTRITQYTFNPAARQITFTGLTSVSLDGILLITNVMTNVIIYNFADPTAGGVVSGNVLTLDYNTSTMSATDPLLIYYDNTDVPATNDMVALLKRMVKMMESQATVDASNRQRVTVEVVPTTAVTVPAAMLASSYIMNGSSNPLLLAGTFSPMLVSEGPVDQRWRIADAAHHAFAASIRSRLN